uniref:alanine and arginine-rich domain-containing protein n=1 Tax=Pristiophorus japonicus TaxID=55135 RepID=UPI00398F2D18
MDPVLTKLKELSSKPGSFADRPGRSSRQPGVYKRQSCPAIEWDPQGKRKRVDMEKALDWLKSELMEMRFQNQTLVKQLMELHVGIQELKKEYDSDRELSESDSDDGGSLNRSHHGQQAAKPQIQNRRNSLP